VLFKRVFGFVGACKKSLQKDERKQKPSSDLSGTEKSKWWNKYAKQPATIVSELCVAETFAHLN
jgi:hypothetical protein